MVVFFFFFSSRRRHTRFSRDWSSDVCSSDLGDGTTTATVLAQALVREGLRNVAAGANPMALKRGIEKAVEVVAAELLSSAKEVETKEQIAATASISAADNQIGELIAEAKIGR